MAGLGHYYSHDDDNTCRNDSSHHSMCRTNFAGTERDRTLAEWDRAAVNTNY
jgi:hypothetical protein